MHRNRPTHLALTLATITLGLLARTSLTPEFIYPYLGDFLYALMIFFIAGLMFTSTNSLKLALYSIAVCYVIECSQLYQTEWIDAIRDNKFGALVLGRGFLWSDLVSYSFGGMTGYVLEALYYRRR